jgi:hypothetical protein
MSCQPPVPCGPAPGALGLVAPVPGESPLRRRVGEYDGFARDLIAQVESELVDGGLLGRDWDVEGDPLASTLVGLWAYVAEIVAAYSELTAAEAYLSTASDWTDLYRVAGLVGYRPRPGVAAQGWVRVVVDRGADPLLPAGTRVQAPGTPQRAAQTFEVAQDTQLYADWNELTATWVPVSVLPDGRRVRFLGDPGFHTGDRVLFVEENPPVVNPCGDPPDPPRRSRSRRWRVARTSSAPRWSSSIATSTASSRRGPRRTPPTASSRRPARRAGSPTSSGSPKPTSPRPRSTPCTCSSRRAEAPIPDR